MNRNKMIAEGVAKMLLNSSPREYSDAIKSMNPEQLEHFGEIYPKLLKQRKLDMLTEELKVACRAEFGTESVL